MRRFTYALLIACTPTRTALAQVPTDLPETAGQAESESPPVESAPAKTEDAHALPTVSEKIADLELESGLLQLARDPEAGTIWLVVPAPDADGRCGTFLYVESIATGIGSNPLGLDRGQLGASRVVHLRRVGRTVLLEQENLRFRAESANADERRAVRDSFATSILWGGMIAARDHDGRTLVDLGSFVVRDAHGIARSLERSGEGAWTLDAGRSVLDDTACMVFPDNIELEAILTFFGKKPGRHVQSVAPDATALTVVQHHALIRLPDDGYRPRRHDPRGGSYGTSYLDYASALDAPIERQWIGRHRLEKTDPAAARSATVEPIVYYVDRGAPEPIRTALVEGASWWAEAFDAAGFVDAFRVEVLPEGAHPLDVRYNVIQWVHRSTRGWSYGGSIEDPRTGEIIKGHVTLGSLRVRQDILLFEGLVGADSTGRGGAPDPVEIALARIRQLSAHEVGHTLGFQHNFAASTWGDRASVMDYPAPLVTIDATGDLDLSSAYGVGIGPWDVHTVRYAYSEFAPGADEDAELLAILDEADRMGMRFLSDADARPAGAAHPLANLWDNGAEPVAALQETLDVRARALERFGLDRIAPGRSFGRLHDVFVPVYLQHRYQVEAATKVIGGRLYRYGIRGGAAAPVEIADAAWQRRALAAVLQCLDPTMLSIREETLALLAPPGPGDSMTGERFRGRTTPTFDPVAAAVTAASPVIDGLLQPERCMRLIEQRARDPQQLGLERVLDDLVARTILRTATTPRTAAIQEAVAHAVVDGLARLSMDVRAAAAVRARAEHTLDRARTELVLRGDRASDVALLRAIERALQRKMAGEWTATAPAPLPPGSPIGCGADHGPY